MSKELDEFLEDIEGTRYLMLSLKYIQEHSIEIEKSMNGEYDHIRESLETRPLREFERLDINWDGERVSVLKEKIVWSIVKAIIINLKSACDHYGESIGMKKNRFYQDVVATLPSFMFTAENGQSTHLTDLLKLCRDEVDHKKTEKKNEAEKKRLGIKTWNECLLKAIHIADNGNEIRVFSYYDGKTRTASMKAVSPGMRMESLETILYDLIEKEVQSMIIAYDSIRTGKYKDEADCIQNNCWRPIKMI